jgi:hypothetical protein
MRRLAVLPIYSTRPIDQSAGGDMDGIFPPELSKVVKYEIVPGDRADVGIAHQSRGGIFLGDYSLLGHCHAASEIWSRCCSFSARLHTLPPLPPSGGRVASKSSILKTMDILSMADGIMDSAEPDVSDLATPILRFRATDPPYRQQDSQGPGSSRRAVETRCILQSPRLYAGIVSHKAFSSPRPCICPGNFRTMSELLDQDGEVVAGKKILRRISNEINATLTLGLISRGQ